MARSVIEDNYFEWMYNLVNGCRYVNENSFRKLLTYLHDLEFTYILRADADRAEDGLDLRYRFAYDYGDEEADLYLTGPCSVLEMMVALAIRCEEQIMDDPGIGDRTGQWFWKMIVNLGLGYMTDRRFDKEYVEEVIERFLHREYEPDGKGGLFTVKRCEFDMRDIDIWIQLCYFLDTII